MHLRLPRLQRGEHPGEPDGLVAQLRPHPLRTAAGCVSLVEDEVEHPEDRTEPRRMLVPRWHLERRVRGRQRLLRAHDPLLHRGCGDEEGAGDLPVDRPPTTRNVRATCASRESTGWHAMKRRRSTSSSTASGSHGRSGTCACSCSSSCAIRARRSSSRSRRRHPSTAFRFATAVSHAAALRGPLRRAIAAARRPGPPAPDPPPGRSRRPSASACRRCARTRCATPLRQPARPPPAQRRPRWSPVRGAVHQRSGLTPARYGEPAPPASPPPSRSTRCRRGSPRGRSPGAPRGTTPAPAAPGSPTPRPPRAKRPR